MAVFLYLKAIAAEYHEKIRLLYLPALVLMVIFIVFHEKKITMDAMVDQARQKSIGSFNISCLRDKFQGRPRCWVWRDFEDHERNIYYTFEVNSLGIQVHAGRQHITSAVFLDPAGKSVLVMDCNVMCIKRQDFKGSLDILQKLFKPRQALTLRVDILGKVAEEPLTPDLVRSVDLVYGVEKVWAQGSGYHEKLE